MIRCGETTYEYKWQYDNARRHERYLQSIYSKTSQTDPSSDILTSIAEIYDSMNGVSQTPVYVLSDVNNETRTFYVKKINVPETSPALVEYKAQYDYLEKISALIGYEIKEMDLDREESIDLTDKFDALNQLIRETVPSIRPECDLSQSFLVDPERVAEFNKQLDQRLEENDLKLYRGKKKADKMGPIL